MIPCRSSSPGLGSGRSMQLPPPLAWTSGAAACPLLSSGMFGLRQMSDALTVAQRLKLQLLAEGLEISPPARKALDEIAEHRNLTPADYASTSGLILELADNVRVNAPINEYNPNFVSDSRYFLDYGMDGFLVHGAGLASPARFWSPPGYHGQVESFGPLNNFVVTHGDRGRLSPVRGCAMTCTFGNIPYDDPLDVYGTKPIDALLQGRPDRAFRRTSARTPPAHLRRHAETSRFRLHARALPAGAARVPRHPGRHHDGAAAWPAGPAGAGQTGPERDLDQHRGVQRIAVPRS